MSALRSVLRCRARTVAGLSICAGLLMICLAPARAEGSAPDAPATLSIDLDVAQATWASLDIHPDGARIVFDMLGDLYSLPIEGGRAQSITSGTAMDVEPRFSPDGTTIVFVSDRGGGNGLWLADADGRNVRPLVQDANATYASPHWSADGRSVFAMRRPHGVAGPESAVVRIGPDRAVDTLIPASDAPVDPFPSPAGRWLYAATGWNGTGPTVIERVELRTGGREVVIEEPGGAARPTLSPDGRWLAYGTLGPRGERLVLHDLANGERRVTPVRLYRDQQDNPLSDGGLLPGFAFTPDSQDIVFAVDGHFQRYGVATGELTPIPFVARLRKTFAARHDPDMAIEDGAVRLRMLRWLQAASDGGALFFGAAGRIFRTDLPSGETVPFDADMLAYAPALSADGRWLAFVGWDDATLGAIYKTPTDRFEPVRISEEAGLYEQLAWSPSGDRLTFVFAPASEVRARPNPNEEVPRSLGWIDAAGGPVHRVLDLPPRGDRRPQMRPTFAPDETAIYFAITPARRGATLFETVGLDGSGRRTIATLPFADDIIVSPDGERLAFTRHARVFVAPMPPPGEAGGPVAGTDAAALPAREVGCGGADFLNWSVVGSALTWGRGPEFYRLDPDNGESGCPLPAHVVDVTLPRAIGHGTIWLAEARIVTSGAAGVIERGAIEVVDGRIATVCAMEVCAIPPDASRMDLGGKTIIPGLIDAHAHYRQSRNGEIVPQADWGNLAQLAYGVTTARDPSARSQTIFTQAEMIATGLAIGPRIFSTGEPFYFQETGFADPPQSRAMIERRAEQLERQGASALKQYILPRREQRQWLVSVARERGMAAIPEGAQKYHFDISLILDGYSTLEHMFKVSPLGEDVLALLAASGTPVVPTLMVGPSVDAQTYFGQRWDFAGDARLARFVPAQFITTLKGRGIPVDDTVEPHFVTLGRSGKDIADAGGALALGAHGDFPGLGAHWEMWAMAMGGLSPIAVIEAATIGSARALGVERDLGSIETGKVADLVVLDENPLADLRNSLSIRLVMQHGRLRDAQDMREIWPDRTEPGPYYWNAANAKDAPSGHREGD